MRIFLNSDPEQPKDWVELIDSLYKCRNYEHRKNALILLAVIIVVFGLSALPYGIAFALKQTAFHKNEFEDLVPYGFLITIALSMIGVVLFLICGPQQDKERETISLQDTEEWDKVFKQLPYISSRLERLTKNPSVLNNFADSLKALTGIYFSLVTEHIDPVITPEALAERGKRVWHLPEWIFNDPQLILQQAAHRKVAEELDKLCKTKIPTDLTDLITDYLIPTPQFQI